MGINDAREQLEVCKDEYGKLERENAKLRAVIERAEDYVTCHYLDTAMGESVLAILTRVPAEKGGGQ